MKMGKGFFRKKAGKNNSAISDADHPARQEIERAVRIADQSIHFHFIGEKTGIQIKPSALFHLMTAVDRALEKSPGDTDLLMAKSALLSCGGKHEKALKIIEKILESRPDHFEARQRKKFPHTWDHLFMHPSWSEKRKFLHPMMGMNLLRGNNIQIIRQGLKTGFAVVFPCEQDAFVQSIPKEAEIVWDIGISESLHGALLLHRLLVKEDDREFCAGEGAQTANPPPAANLQNGNCLLHLMNHLDSCFIVLTDGHHILYNTRYDFSAGCKAKIRNITDELIRRNTQTDTGSFLQMFREMQAAA